MPVMKGYEYIAKWFRAAEVDTIFLVPTNLFASLIELHSLDPGIKLVLAHSEKAAAYMADGYAQASGKPGIVITQAGPGGPNVMAGLAEPFQSHTPVISMTGQTNTDSMRGNDYQEIATDFRQTVKFDAEILSATRLPDLLNTAFREATTGAPGPVHLGFGPRVEGGEIDVPEPADVPCTRYPPHRPSADKADVAEAVRMIKAAQRPVIIAGGGAITSGAWGEITELAERLQTPVATSLSGKGIIAGDHPLAIGPVGAYSRRAGNEIVKDADLVLFVGAHGGGQLTDSRKLPRPGAAVVHIDINPAQIGKNVPVSLGLIGDARTVVAQMNDAAGEGGEHSEWTAAVARRMREWWEQQAEDYDSDASPIEPARLARDLSASLPEDALMASDTGYAAGWAGAYLTLPAGRNFLRCEGSLGWALPAAVGAKCGAPERPVVAWTGDGGFWYHIGELETAIRCDIPVVAVVLNNNGLKFDTHVLDFLFGKKGKQAYALSEFSDVDFAKIATSMGALGWRVEQPDEIGPTIREALAAGRTAVVDVAVSDSVAPVRMFERHATG